MSARRLALLLPCATALAAPAAAQLPRDLSAVVGRPLSELVEELPGRPRSLGELVAVALERNLELEASRLDRRLALAGVQVEGGSFDPGLSFSAGLERDRLVGDRAASYRARIDQLLPWGTALGLDLTGSRSPSVAGLEPSFDADVGLSLTQPLLEGLGTADADLRVARLLDQASIHRLTRATDVAVARVELSYWDLAEAEAIQAVLRRSWEIAEALLSRNEQLAARELVAEVDVLTARSGVALRRSGLVDARRARRDAAEALLFEVWGEGATAELSADTLPIKTRPGALEVPATPEEVETAALDARGDLAAARAELRGAEVAREATRNARLPSFSLDGTVRSGGTRSALGSSLGALDEAWSWSVGLRFSQPLGNRRDRGLDVVAELRRELSRIELVRVENLVRLDVRAAVRAIRAGEERLAAADEAAELAREQLESERRRLDLGLGDSFRLLETEENAVQAELESVRARYDLARAATRFRLAVGGIADRYPGR